MRKTTGLSIVELLLVLAIAGFIVMMGMRQYFSYRLDADVTLIKYNTNTLFAAMSDYFQAYCSHLSGPLSPGPGNPGTVVLNIQNDLIAAKFLNANQLISVPSLLLEGTSGTPAENRIAAYKVRFVPTKVARPRFFRTPPKLTPQSLYPASTTSQWFTLWRPEIMVLIRNVAQTQGLQQMTFASDCVQTNWTSVNCENAPAIRFSHLVSFTNHVGVGSNYWTTTPSLGALREQEGNFGPHVLFPVTSPPGTPPYGYNATEQYYVCGG